MRHVCTSLSISSCVIVELQCLDLAFFLIYLLLIEMQKRSHTCFMLSPVQRRKTLKSFTDFDYRIFRLPPLSLHVNRLQLFMLCFEEGGR
ncbi:hypothetical protein AHF37_09806 [Paragonimus kellicotti]|nr:hypothetical protein AHF37_09806 [Paragonimus kellicotti]